MPAFVSMNRASATKAAKRKAKNVSAQSPQTFQFKIVVAGSKPQWVKAEGKTKAEAQATLKLKKSARVAACQVA